MSVLCLLCSGGLRSRYEVPHIWHQSPGSRSFSILWCDTCQLGRLDPVPRREELERFYDETYSSRYAAQAGAPHPPTILERLQMRVAWKFDRNAADPVTSLVDRVGPPPKTVCDVGCGNGDFLSAMKQRGYAVTGVELNAAARARAAEKGVEVHTGYAEALPPAIASRHFDLVVLCQVLEHCLDPLRALRQALSILAPGGTLYIEVPNHACVSSQRMGSCWFHTDAGRHLTFFTGKALENLVERAGAEVSAVQYSGYTSQFTPARRRAEQEVFSRLCAGRHLPRGARRTSTWEQYRTLGRTLFAEDAAKYETVGVVARSPSQR